MMRDFGLSLSTEEFIAMILEVDETGNGEMEFSAFVTLMKPKVLGRDPEREILKAFPLFAESPDSEVITYDDLRRLADDLGTPFTDHELQEMIDEADTYGIGGVSRQDFVSAMRRTGIFQT